MKTDSILEMRKRQMSDAEKRNRMIGQFNPEGSRGEWLLNQICRCQAETVNRTSINALYMIVASLLNLKIDRNIQRNRILVIKFFDDYAEAIMGLLSVYNIIPQIFRPKRKNARKAPNRVVRQDPQPESNPVTSTRVICGSIFNDHYAEYDDISELEFLDE